MEVTITVPNYNVKYVVSDKAIDSVPRDSNFNCDEYIQYIIAN